MTKAFLVGDEPLEPLGFTYVTQGEYDAVVIGSLQLHELLRFSHPEVLKALAQGKQVLLYTPGLPEVLRNRALSAALTCAQRELKNWGVLFTDGGRKRLVTAQEARLLRQQGRKPNPESVLTPLAKEILEGLE